MRPSLLQAPRPVRAPKGCAHGADVLRPVRAEPGVLGARDPRVVTEGPRLLRAGELKRTSRLEVLVTVENPPDKGGDLETVPSPYRFYIYM